MSDSSDDTKVRFIGVYEDPQLDEGVFNFRYLPNTPDETLSLRDLETNTVRTVTLQDVIKLGSWVTVEEARDYLFNDVDIDDLNVSS